MASQPSLQPRGPGPRDGDARKHASSDPHCSLLPAHCPKPLSTQAPRGSARTDFLAAGAISPFLAVQQPVCDGVDGVLRGVKPKSKARVEQQQAAVIAAGVGYGKPLVCQPSVAACGPKHPNPRPGRFESSRRTPWSVDRKDLALCAQPIDGPGWGSSSHGRRRWGLLHGHRPLARPFLRLRWRPTTGGVGGLWAGFRRFASSRCAAHLHHDALDPNRAPHQSIGARRTRLGPGHRTRARQPSRRACLPPSPRLPSRQPHRDPPQASAQAPSSVDPRPIAASVCCVSAGQKTGD